MIAALCIAANRPSKLHFGTIRHALAGFESPTYISLTQWWHTDLDVIVDTEANEIEDTRRCVHDHSIRAADHSVPGSVDDLPVGATHRDGVACELDTSHLTTHLESQLSRSTHLSIKDEEHGLGLERSESMDESMKKVSLGAHLLQTTPRRDITNHSIISEKERLSTEPAAKSDHHVVPIDDNISPSKLTLIDESRETARCVFLCEDHALEEMNGGG